MARLRVKWVKGELVPTRPGVCESHTDCPSGYIQWHEWAEEKNKTHTQRRCQGCGLYAIWEPRTNPPHSGAQEG